MAAPLDGIRIVDCSDGLAGPKATGILADYGAEVIWVEPPGGFSDREVHAVNYSAHNRGKRSVVLDLTDADGRAQLAELIATADVFVENWGPGIAAERGFGHDELRARHPRLVSCSITGFGTHGQQAEWGDHETIVNAFAGTMYDQRGNGEGPFFPGLPMASSGAAYLAVMGILGALNSREVDGAGRLIETSLLDGVLAFLRINWGSSGAAPLGYEIMMTRRMVARPFEAGDGEYFGISTMASGGFDRLIKAVGLEDRVSLEGGLETAMTPEEAMIVHMEMPEIFKTEPRDHWVEKLLEADLCVMPFLRPGEVFDQEPVKYNGMVVEVDDPTFGRLQQVAPPIKLHRSPGGVQGPAPTVGQHTDEVLGSLDAAAPDSGVATPAAGALLEGVKVLDLGHWYAAPYSARTLADLGADVVKVEPLHGDPMRPYERAFSNAQAGKRAIALDLKTDGAKEIAGKLVEWADVIVHNFRAGVAEGLGLGYDDVKKVNPDVVYLHISGWGSSGPNSQRQSLAPMMSGYVGSAYETGGQFNPPVPPAGHEDCSAGMIVGSALLLGLLHRRRTGEGQFCEVPMLHSAMEDVAHIVRQADGTVLGAGALDSLQRGTSPLQRMYDAADGLICIAVESDDELRGLSTVIGTDILADERFATRAARVENAYSLERLIADAFAEQKADEIEALCKAAGVAAIVPAVNNGPQIFEEPANLEAGRVVKYEHPETGQVCEVGTLLRVDGAPPVTVGRPPLIGEHGDEILAELGYSADAVASLRSAGAVV